MPRSLGVAVVVGSLALGTTALAQLDATAAQDRAIRAWVDYRAVRAHHGVGAEATEARATEARAAALELGAALRGGPHLDLDGIRAGLERDLADVLARLAELGTRCGGPAVEVLAAEARRDALREAIDQLATGEPFVPTID